MSRLSVQQVLARADESFVANLLLKLRPESQPSGEGALRPLTRDALLQAPWKLTSHPDVREPFFAFDAPFWGVASVVDISSLSDEASVRLEPHGDSGRVRTVYTARQQIPRATKMTAIVGPRPDNELVLCTIVPGPPVLASVLFRTVEMELGTFITQAEAKEFGFQYAYVERPLK